MLDDDKGTSIRKLGILKYAEMALCSFNYVESVLHPMGSQDGEKHGDGIYTHQRTGWSRISSIFVPHVLSLVYNIVASWAPAMDSPCRVILILVSVHY